jgi:hypothetical protein
VLTVGGGAAAAGLYAGALCSGVLCTWATFSGDAGTELGASTCGFEPAFLAASDLGAGAAGIAAAWTGVFCNVVGIAVAGVAVAGLAVELAGEGVATVAGALEPDGFGTLCETGAEAVLAVIGVLAVEGACGAGERRPIAATAAITTAATPPAT